jgi:hypothetical protein
MCHVFVVKSRFRVQAPDNTGDCNEADITLSHAHRVRRYQETACVLILRASGRASLRNLATFVRRGAAACFARAFLAAFAASSVSVMASKAATVERGFIGISSGSDPARYA